MNKRIPAVITAITLAVSGISGCAFDPSSVPIPGTSVSGPTYRINIEFTNALNLPARARVIANGVTVGTLHSVAVVDPSGGQPGHVSAAVDVEDSVHLPTDTTAQLRQNTILGDIFIGLTIPPTPATAMMSPGDTIPLQRTEPALQIEDLMAGLSTFISGGAVQRFQDIIDDTNSILPDQPVQTARVFGILGHDTQDLAGHLDTVDQFLDSLQQDMQGALANPTAVDDLLSAQGSTSIPADANSLVLTLGIIGGLGIVGQALGWLAPFLKVTDASAEALVPLLLSANHPLNLDAPSNMNRLIGFLRNRLIPFSAHPQLNITGVQTQAAGSSVPTDVQVSSMISTLRMIGVVR